MGDTAGKPIVRQEKYHYFDDRSNSNKDWTFRVFADGSAETEYGRTGYKTQITPHPKGDGFNPDTAARDKMRHGYKRQGEGRAVVTVSHSSLEKRTAEFISWISQEAGKSISDVYTGNVDVISQSQLDEGRQLLGKIIAGRIMRSPNIADLVREYYRTIPQNLGRKIDATNLVNDFDAYAQEQLLNQLEGAVVTHDATSIDQVYQMLGAELKPMDLQSPAYRDVCDYINRTAPSVQIQDVFSVKIPGERQAFKDCVFGAEKVADLFHGTQTGRIRDILRSGLIIPKTAANGSRFGRGIYLADQARRSLNYSSSNHKDSRALFIVSAKIGKQAIRDDDDSRLHEAPYGYHSVLGVKSHSGMDEYIVYRPEQVTIRALVTIGGRR